MSNHERFKELCVLAATGEISGEELRALSAHLERCTSCEKTFADMKEIHATWLPERNGFEIKRSFAAESKLRQSILQRIGAEGAQFSSEALSSMPPAFYRPGQRHQRLLYRLAAAVVLLALTGAGILGWISSRRLGFHPSAPATTARSRTAPLPAPSPPTARREASDEIALRTEQAQRQLHATLEIAEAQRLHLEERLADAERRASIAQQSNTAALRQVSDLTAQLETTRESKLATESQLAALESSNSDKEVELNLVLAENTELREKLTSQAARIDSLRDLKDKTSEISDLIAARNLHIIDVYDTSGGGTTQKSFGRVFYTEGRSLVFYAYDLPSPRPTAKYAYYAWGKRDGSGEVKARNLGIFYSDDHSQRRWVLTITDPQVLSGIDSVFVTLQKTDHPAEMPSGEKLLSAYLRTPANHP